jgi:hypothetical protein
MHASPKHAASQAAPRSCFLGAFAAFVGASFVVAALFFLGLDERAPTSCGGVSLWRLVDLPILSAGFGFVAGPARFGEGRHGDDA